MERPSYLSKYQFDWDLCDVVVGGQSALDTKFFTGQMMTLEEVHEFLHGYGLDPNDPVVSAELFGNFQESLQFIRRYFLKEGNDDGLDLKIPNRLLMISDISDLFLLATGGKDCSLEEKLWAEIVLKVMHTILHADKDLRSNYFSIIQTQIFDRFYKHIYRDEDNHLYLGDYTGEDSVKLHDFEAKSKKSRESVIIKLLHKPENVAEEVFDRIGVRIVTKSRLDILRVINYLIEKNIVIPHNIKPSRSINTMFDLNQFKERYQKIIREAIREKMTEEDFVKALDDELYNCDVEENIGTRNIHSLKNYKSIQFTTRQLIIYRNPFISEFSEVRRLAKEEGEENSLAKKVLNMDYSLVSRDIRFFYPFEVQVIDDDAHEKNTQGEASHIEYKRNQVIWAMKRVFRPLMEYKGIPLS